MFKPKPVLVLAVGCVIVGVGLGKCSEPDHPIRTVYVKTAPRVQVKTHVIEKEVIVTKPLPASCKEVIALMQRSLAYDGDMAAGAGQILDALVNHASGAASSDVPEINRSIVAVRSGRDVLDTAAVEKAAVQPLLVIKTGKCNRDIAQGGQ